MTTQSHSFLKDTGRTATTPESAHPVAGARRSSAAVLTTIAAGLAIACSLAFGWLGALVVLLTLPVPLVLLWASADVVRFDERERGRERSP